MQHDDKYIPKGLLEYYHKINGEWNKINVPKCPICNKKMQYVEHEFIEYKDEIGTIRKFKCENCIEKEILLWRK
jgi:transposase-like protein